MGDSSLRRFLTNLVPGRTVTYERKEPKQTEWGIPGMTKPGVDYRKKTPKPHKPGKPSNGIGVSY